MHYPKRIDKIKKVLGRKKLDALLVSQPQNRLYLSGYTASDHGIAESSGHLLIPRKGTPYLFTDFRFQEQAEKEAEGFKVELYPKGLIQLLRQILPDLGLKKIGFESDYTLHSTSELFFGLNQSHSVDMSPTAGIIEKFRRIKEEDELELIRKSVHLNEKVFQKTFKSISTEDTEIDLALQIAAEMKRKGAEKESFDTIVASGSNSSLPHAVPGRNRLTRNAPLLIDMGLILNGYCSDMTRSFYIGKPDKKYVEIHRIVRKAQKAGIAAVRAGVTGKEVDAAARKIITDSGYGKYFGHSLGHGVGLEVHEEPRVSPRSRKKLRENMVITIEPGIYIPGWGGIRLENMVIVHKDGCEELNSDTTQLDL